MALVYSTGPLENDLPNPSERVAARALNNGVEKVTVLWLAFALDGTKRLVDSARVTLGPQESTRVALHLDGALQFEVEAQVEGRAQGLEAAQALGGPRLQAGAGLAHVREPVTDTAVRRYERGHAQVGLRWPLLGSREAAQRAVDEAEVALALAHLQVDEAQALVRQQVRRSYLELVAARQRAAAARAWLGTQPAVAQALARREAAGLLLAADHLAFQTQADTVERDLARQEVAARAAQRELLAWAGPAAEALIDPARTLGWPQWPAMCRDRGRLLAAAPAQPGLARARVEGDAARRAAARGRLDGIDAGLTVSQSLRACDFLQPCRP